MDTLHFPFKSQRITRLSELDEYFDEYRKDKADEAILESFYNAFAANDFDVDAFMIAGSYNLITDRVLRYELLKRILNVAPISEFFPGRIGKVKSSKSAELFGDTLYLLDTCGDFFSNPDGSNSWVESLDEGTRKELKALNIDEDDYVSNLGRHLDEETILYLYQCNSEYDLWKLFASGMGSISELFRYYYNSDSQKARQFLKYVYKESGLVCPALGFGRLEWQGERVWSAQQIKEKYHGDAKRIRTEIEEILLGVNTEDAAYMVNWMDDVDESEAVDLGLSVKWAEANIGACSQDLYGSYFSWIQDGDHDSRCDIADVNLGGFWRIPTGEELQELVDNCTWSVESVNGVEGERATSKINGNSIFFPYAGYKRHDKGWEKTAEGHYWSSSINEKGFISLSLKGARGRYVSHGNNFGFDKLSIRPVLDDD